MSHPPTSDDPAMRVSSSLMLMCPESMRPTFEPLVAMALAQIPPESLSALANDLETAYDDNGNVDVDKLISVGKQFGLTDEMVAGYQSSFAAMGPAVE